MPDLKKELILSTLREIPWSSSKEIHVAISSQISYATVKRIITQLLSENLIETKGSGKGTKYAIGLSYNLLYEINVSKYFEIEQDKRIIKNSFNYDLAEQLMEGISLFTENELEELNQLHNFHVERVAELNPTEYAKELERLAIDLSWKSSQIEGNTYSLLETERLLKEKETAAGKTKDDAVMLLNHKDALDFIITHTDFVNVISPSIIEDIHSLLIKELGVDRNIRSRRVGISGTNYTPLDNDHQIREALSAMCTIINSRTLVFEKALIALILISYIQPFADGNKRTARIISNAILMANGYCPLSFRTVDSIEYKMAMLIFYEQNNISAMKTIFKSQYEFAVKTYF